ncbi:GumC family protein [Acuticoccus yangtzensis]|uniref:GumC family protein n=1 Tax=Acuticoccus yangtzensis TaxID=1443441 RepID=UPI000949A6E1|nr:exopolysaccharide transport family protein [Acuticoccus yangtzensis]
MSTVETTNEGQPAGAGPNPLAPIIWLAEAFWQYKWLVMTVMAAGVIAAAVLAGRLPNVYSASGLVEIDPGQESLLPRQQVSSGYVPPETITETEVQVIRSYAVLERVVDELALEFSAANPALRAATAPGGTVAGRESARAEIISDLQDKLVVRPTGRSYVVEVAYEGANPVFVASIVNAVMRQYLSLDIAAQRDQATDSISQISQRLGELRADLDMREQAVEDFRAQSRITEGAGTTIIAEQLADLNEELVRAQGALAQARAAADQTRAGGEVLPQVVTSPLIQELRAQATIQQRALSELDALYRPSHPRVIQAREALEAIQADIATETDKIVNSLSTSVGAEAERVASLEREADALREQLSAQRGAEIELRRLEREVDAAQRVYETLLNRYREVQGVAGLERPDGRIVAAAVPPGSPSGPNRALVVAGGGILAGAAAFALVLGIALIDQRIRTRGDITRTVGIAPLAVVPPVPSSRGVLAGLAGRRRNAAFAEAITHLRAALVLRQGGRDPTIIAMTAPDNDVGHADLITALAQACAVAGDATVLVDANFNDPTVHERLGGSNEFGVSDLVMLGGEVDAALQVDRATPLNYLAAGKQTDPSLYRSKAMGSLVDALYRRFDVVIINLPPIVERPDAQALAAEAEAVAIAARAGFTSHRDLVDTVQTLRFVGPSLPLATVLIRS